MRYIIPIVVLMLGCAIACGYFAFKTRDIADARFAESSWMFYTFFVQLQVMLVGIPILVILDESSAEATYLGRCLLIFAMVVTTLILMVGPKIALLSRQKSNAQSHTERTSSSDPHATQHAGTQQIGRGAGNGSVVTTGLRQPAPAPLRKSDPTDDLQEEHLDS